MIFSLGKIELKYFIYFIVYFVIQIYSNYILYIYSKKIGENKLLEPFLSYFGYLLIIIPELIAKKCNSSDSSKIKIEREKNNENFINRPYKYVNDTNNNNIKIKDVIIFFSFSFLGLALEFSYILVELLNENYIEEYFIFGTLIWFIAPEFILKKKYLASKNINFIYNNNRSN